MSIRDSILEAEEKAANIKNEAVLEGKVIVETAKENATTKAIALIDEANTKASKILLETEQTIKNKKDESITNCNKAKEDLSALAEKNIDTCVELVLERIL